MGAEGAPARVTRVSFGKLRDRLLHPEGRRLPNAQRCSPPGEGLSGGCTFKGAGLRGGPATGQKREGRGFPPAPRRISAEARSLLSRLVASCSPSWLNVDRMAGFGVDHRSSVGHVRDRVDLGKPTHTVSQCRRRVPLISQRVVAALNAQAQRRVEVAGRRCR